MSARNTTFKLNDIKELTKSAVSQVDQTKWKKCVDHVKKVEVEMCRLDGIRDVIEEIEIDLRSSESGMSDTDSNFESNSKESESSSGSDTESYEPI